MTPPWRYLLRYLRRMEDRGEVLGGRFVDGFSGEQFALPEAVGLLRSKAAESGERRSERDQRGRSAQPGRDHHPRRENALTAR